MNEQQFKSLPLEQRKAHQERLQALGLYVGKIDGNWGEGTRTAFSGEEKQRVDAEATAGARAEKERADKLEADRLEIERTKVQQAGKQVDTEAAATAAKAARQEDYQRQENSTLGIGTKIAAGPGALMSGKALGLGLGAGINTYMNEGQRGRNVTLRQAADDRVRGLTTREGAVTGTRLAGAMPSANSYLRVGGRMAPHVGLGALALGTGYELLGDVDPDQPFYPRMADRAFGLANIGAGSGLLTQGIKQAAQPGVSPDAASLAIINSNQLRRNNAPQEPEAPSGPRPGTVPALRAEAKAAGIPQAYKMNKGALTQALESINQGTKKLPGLALPLAAGSLAYAATPDRAEAADGSGGGGNQAEALTNAGVAGGTAYGASKGLGALSRFAPMAGKAAGGALSMLTPTMAADAYDPTQEDLNMDRNTAARTLPRGLQFGGVDRAYQMAQVPERAPAGGDGFANARALQIPAGIPLPRQDGSSPYGDAQASAPMDFNRALADFQSLMAQQGQQ